MIENNICHICFSKITFLGKNCCKICSFPLELSFLSESICGLCLVEKPIFSELKSVFYYDEHSSILLKKFKYYDKPELAKYFSKLMYNYDREYFSDVDYITSVPLYWTRQIKRLYNQASLLAADLSSLSNKKFLSHIVKRVKHTKPQFNLTKNQRQENLRNAFEFNPRKAELVKNKTILLIDDIYTTGGTINCVIKEIIKLEVKKVKVMTLTRRKF